MAKVKVKESFVDRYTKVVYPVGKELDLAEERIKEIQKAYPFLIQVLPETKKEGK